MLTLYEELFLLALDEEKGNILPFAKKTLPFGLAGAILAELALQDKVCTNEKQRLLVMDENPTGEEILDDAVREIQSEEKHRKLSFWISQFSEKPKKLRMKVGESLAAKKLVSQDENRFYIQMPPQTEQEQPAPSKYEMKKPLRAIIFAGAEADPHNLALLNIANACDLLGLIFTQDEQPMAKRLVHEKVIQAALKNPSLQTIEEIEYAITASIEDSGE